MSTHRMPVNELHRLGAKTARRARPAALILVLVAGISQRPSCVICAAEPVAAARQEVSAPKASNRLDGPSAESIAQWAGALDDEQYAVRAEATRRLIDAGGAALEPVTAVALHGSPEATLRALTVLEALYTRRMEPADPIADSIETTLERLAESANHSAASRAEEVLERNDDLREARAAANIRRLQGVVRYKRDGGANLVGPRESATQRRVIKGVIIPPQWKGGDEGLRFVKRLTQLEILYRVSGNHVSDKGIREVQQALPDTLIEIRGPANLGIEGSPIIGESGTVWRIDWIDKDSAADRGGVQVGDVIAKFAGKDVPDFKVLIEQIKQTKPGDKVDMVVLRSGSETTLKIEMQAWRNLDD